MHLSGLVGPVADGGCEDPGGQEVARRIACRGITDDLTLLHGRVHHPQVYRCPRARPPIQPSIL